MGMSGGFIRGLILPGLPTESNSIPHWELSRSAAVLPGVRFQLLMLRIQPASALKPKAGAVCGNSARMDLCGGWQVTAIPTATS